MDTRSHDMEAVLVESCSPIFNLVEPLRQPEQADLVESSLRADLEQAFVELERRAFEHQWPSAVTRDVRYCMAAYVDERVMSSRWPHKFDWMVKPLCVEYFGDSNAGEGFFARLDELRRGLPEHRAVAELYFSCLQFGYQGSYTLKGFDQLQAYIATFRAQLDDLRGPVNRELADQAVPERQLVYRIGGNQPYWVMAAVGGALLVALFLTYGGLMKSALSGSADRLLQYQTSTQVMNGDQADG